MKCFIEEEQATVSSSSGGSALGKTALAVSIGVAVATSAVAPVLAQAPVPYVEQGPRIPGDSLNDYVSENGGNVAVGPDGKAVSTKYIEWAQASGFSPAEIEAALKRIGEYSIILTEEEVRENVIAANNGMQLPHPNLATIPGTTGIVTKVPSTGGYGEFVLGNGITKIFLGYNNGVPLYQYLLLDDKTGGLPTRIVLNGVTGVDQGNAYFVGTSSYNWVSVGCDIKTGSCSHLGNVSYEQGLTDHRRSVPSFSEILSTGGRIYNKR